MDPEFQHTRETIRAGLERTNRAFLVCVILFAGVSVVAFVMTWVAERRAGVTEQLSNASRDQELRQRETLADAHFAEARAERVDALAAGEWGNALRK